MLSKGVSLYSPGSNIGKKIFCLPPRSLIVFSTYDNVIFNMLVLCDLSLTVIADKISTNLLLFQDSNSVGIRFCSAKCFFNVSSVLP